MTTLLINGSPRKGNTFLFLTRLSARLEAAGHHTEVVHLADLRLKPCTGCYQCVLEGPAGCPLADDVSALWGRIEAADAIVVGAPVFALGVPGMTKNFLDRVASHAHRPTLRGKPAVLLSTTAGMGTEAVLAQLKWLAITGLRIVGTAGFLVYPGRAPLPRTVAREDLTLDRLARNLDRAARARHLRRPTLIEVIQFHGLKLNSAFAPEVYRADHAYYASRAFHDGPQPGPLQRVLGALVSRIGTYALGRSFEARR